MYFNYYIIYQISIIVIIVSVISPVTDGEQFRTRSCNNPMPKFGGADCAGDRSEKKACTVVECGMCP